MIHLDENRYEYMEEVNEGILRNIPKNTSTDRMLVLDVGCGTGALSEAIKKRGYVTCGIESNEKASVLAASRVDKVLCIDLQRVEDIISQLGPARFDMIVFSDVLEHLYNPLLVVNRYKPLLKKGGLFIISVPNAVVWTQRLKILFGIFGYADTGVVDRTHIRFFTFRTAKLLLKTAGFEVIRTDYTPFIIRSLLPIIKRLLIPDKRSLDTSRRQLIDSPFYRFYMQYVYPLEYYAGWVFKRFFAFRIILVGRL